jgi:hypothetical protein
VALTVTREGLGIIAGARYRPVDEIVPTVASPPTMPLTFQTTAVFVAFCTVAVNCCVRLIRRRALPGEMLTLTAAAAVAVGVGLGVPVEAGVGLPATGVGVGVLVAVALATGVEVGLDPAVWSA